jgi:cathepsin B
LADRACIATNGAQTNVLISTQELISCAHNGGCAGGTAEAFWKFANTSGIVLESCLPYASSNNAETQNVAACPATCADKKTSVSKSSTHFATQIRYFSTDAATKQELMTNGPIMASFDVYRDFYSYKSGIYHHVSGDKLGGKLFYNAFSKL